MYILKAAIFVLLSLSSCSGNNNRTQLSEPDPIKFSLHLDTQTVHQEIDHCGASDAWSGQFVGIWPDPKKEAIADLLFGKGLDSQENPVGIGLSLWRINLGAGSAQQAGKTLLMTMGNSLIERY